MAVSPEQKAAADLSGLFEPRPPGSGMFGLAWLNRDLFWLFVLRVLRSISQGYLGLILPLYLVALGYGAMELGFLLAVGAVYAAAASMVIGLVADRFGRRNSIIVISLMFMVGGIGFALSHSFVWLIVFSAIGAIGRGGAIAGGAWGMFYPAVQALVAERSTDYDRTTVFGAFSFVGVLAAAAGSLLAGLPSVLGRWFGTPELHTYQLLFIFSGVMGLFMAVAALPVKESEHLAGVSRDPDNQAAPAENTPAPREQTWGLSRDSWRLVFRFMITNSTNGLAIGMLGPFVVYWFVRRYGVSAAQLAEVFFLLNCVTSLPYLFAGRLALRMGAVRSVVWTRLTGAALMMAVVLMPSFYLAALMYGIRAIFNVLSIPVRQSYVMGVITPAERSTAAAFSNFPSQVTSAAGPYMAGYMMEHISLAMPLEFAALMQGVNALLYWVFFRNIFPPEELAEMRRDAAQ